MLHVDVLHVDGLHVDEGEVRNPSWYDRWQVGYIGESGSAGWRSNLLLFVDLLGLMAVVLVVLVSVLR